MHRTERDSHPIGTTVKVTSFFESAPVYKQTALKKSAKWLAKIRNLMQAYALARPTIRFRLHVLKAKNNKHDFIFDPKTTANVEDAVLKIMGRDCALQCDWTAMASDDFEMHACLPKLTAAGPKVANFGGFISTDNIPVSNSRGTLKNIVSIFKGRLSKANASFAGVRDPFFYLNICSPDSYDPNIEPAKDDVLFEDGNAVVALFEKLLVGYYPEAIADTETPLAGGDVEVSEPPLSSQQYHEQNPEETISQNVNADVSDDIEAPDETSMVRRSQQHRQSQWISSMYDIDEEDVGVTQDDYHPEVEEEEELRAAAISNPWTIAHMNAPLKPNKTSHNEQLLSPAKSRTSQPSAPATIVTT